MTQEELVALCHLHLSENGTKPQILPTVEVVRIIEKRALPPYQKNNPLLNDDEIYGDESFQEIVYAMCGTTLRHLLERYDFKF